MKSVQNDMTVGRPNEDDLKFYISHLSWKCLPAVL